VSSNKLEKFARMANQIGDYYATMPADEAAKGVANHIQKFWTPKMVAETLAAIEQQNLTLNETALQGFAILRSNSGLAEANASQA
jgi:formate dehydrogenase subunit delta